MEAKELPLHRHALLFLDGVGVNIEVEYGSRNPNRDQRLILSGATGR